MGVSLFSSLAGSFVGALTLTLMIPFATGIARSMASPELFMLALFGVSFLAPLSGASRARGLIAGGLGVMLATIGLDPMTSTPRFTFGQLWLWDGIGPIPVALGLYAIPEIAQLAAAPNGEKPKVASSPVRVVDGLREVGREWRVVLQSSAIGSTVALIPGVGANVAQWLAYAWAARRVPKASAFGEGAIEGVIAPSAANNATLGGSLVPALALGMPGGLLSALLVSALVMKGLVPGPLMIVPEAQGGHLTLVFTLIWLVVFANVLAVVLACMATDLLARITHVRPARLVPFLLVLTLVGAFAERQSLPDLLITSVLGALGLAMVRFRWPRAPLLMAIVLTPLAENRLFLSMDAYGLTWLVRPGVLLLGVAIAVGLAVPVIGRDRSPARGATAPVATGESIFCAVLIVLLAAAFAAAGAYALQPAALTRAFAGAAILGLLAMLTVTLRRVTRESLQVHAAGWQELGAWMLVFLASIWILGFVAGAPLALLGYLVLTAREPLTFAAASSAAMFLFLHLILERLLGMPFPPGALSI
jgi:TctA family transporter